MLWPSQRDYAQAVDYYPHISILDPRLTGGNPRRGFNNSLMVYTGGFSIVFPIEVSSSTYALRCWIADIRDAKTRYKEVSDYLKQCRLPYFVDFEYVPNGIMVNGDRYPITRMEWAEGATLCDFIEHNLQDARCLKTAAVEFQKMVTTLHAHQISHGDLQDGNILLKRNGTDVEIKLIDYDSVFVPALRGHPDTIVGVPAYQHPQRIACGVGAAEKMDYFSELVIYLSLVSLAEKHDLWSQFGAPTERRLLFIAEDFKNPDQSDVFRELESLSPDVKQLSSKLKEFCKQSVDQLEPLEAVLPKTSPTQVAHDQGLAYLHSNRYNEAIVEFEKAIGLDPNYKEAHHGLGLAHLKMGNFGEAKKAAEAALRIDSQYQPAIQLLGIIESSTFGSPVSPSTGTSGQTSTSPTSQSSPLTGASSPDGTSKSQSATSNLWQYITGALAFILLICIVALATQISAKDEALRRIKVLTNQQSETPTTSSIRTLSKEKARLIRENQGLQNQLHEQNKQTQTQSATGRKLRNEKEELRNQNRKLQNQLTEQNKETKTRIATIQREKEKLYSQNQTLQDEKEELSSQNQELHNQNTILRNQSRLDTTTSSIRTLSKEKARLVRENQRLQNQLTAHDEQIKNETAIVEQLRNEKEKLFSQKRKLQNENKMLLEQLDKQKPSPFLPDDSDQFRAEPVQEIDHSSRQVDSTARSKNNQGLFQWDYNKAIEFFEDARKIDSQSAIIHYNLGSAYLAMKEYVKSKNCLQKAVTLDPRFKEAYYNLALAYLGCGDRQEAKRQAQKSLSIDKNYRSARQLLGYIKRLIGD